MPRRRLTLEFVLHLLAPEVPDALQGPDEALSSRPAGADNARCWGQNVPDVNTLCNGASDFPDLGVRMIGQDAGVVGREGVEPGVDFIQGQDAGLLVGRFPASGVFFSSSKPNRREFSSSRPS